LDEIIKFRKEQADKYAEYLKMIAELVKKVAAGKESGTPEALNTPARLALYNNLQQNEALAIKIDETVKQVRPDGWRGVQPREQIIKAALYAILQDVAEVERIFLIISQQKEY
jgi:type I restriction enzyme R subunit